jgi:hypothetical protein
MGNVRGGGKPIATVSDPDRSPAASSERASLLAELPPRAHIERIASRKIKGFCGTIDEDGVYYDPVHKQNQSLSQHIIADYHGRFLIELIQNGHDAHDREGRDGEIYRVFGADTAAKARRAIVAGREFGFNPGRRTEDLVEESSVLPMCQAISAFEGPWDEAFIAARSVRLAELAWDTVHPWLQPPPPRRRGRR